MFVTLAVLAALVAQEAAELGGPLLRNGGFEAPGSSEAAHWHLFVRDMEGAYGRVSTSRAHGGERSAELYAPQPYDEETVNSWSQNIVEPLGGAELELTGYIATEEATEAAIWIQCFESEPLRTIAQGSTSAEYPMWGTKDWQKVRLTLEVPNRTDFLVVRCALLGKGAAWFDDIRIEAKGQARRNGQGEEPDSRRETGRPSPAEIEEWLAGETMPGLPSLLPPEMTRGLASAGDFPGGNETSLEWLRDLYGREGGMEMRRLLTGHRELLEGNRALRERNEALSEELEQLQRENEELRRRLDILENRLPERPRPPQAPRRPGRPEPLPGEEES